MRTYILYTCLKWINIVIFDNTLVYYISNRNRNSLSITLGGVTMKENKKKDYILVGDMVCNLLCIATNTLWISFILSMGMNAYQLVNVGSTVIAMVAGSIYLSKKLAKASFLDKCFNKYKLFLVIEALSSILGAVLVIVTKSVWSCVILSLALRPFGVLQRMNNNKLMSVSFTSEERVVHDNKEQTYGQTVQLIGLGLGFIVNMFISAPVGVAISFVAEAINNIFYWRQYEQMMEETTEDIKEDAA